MTETSETTFRDTVSPTGDAMADAALVAGRMVSSVVDECQRRGLNDANALGLVMAASLSLFVERQGTEAALGFVGETVQFLNQSLIYLADQVPYDAEDGPGVIARLNLDPIKTKTKTKAVYRAMQCVVRSASGAFFLVDVSPTDARIGAMSLDEVKNWVRRHGSQEEAQDLIARLA